MVRLTRKMANINTGVLERIYKSSLKLLVPLTPDETYAVIVREAIKLVNGDFGNVVLEQNNQLIKVYSSAPEGYKVKFRKTGFTYQAFKNHAVLIKSIAEFKNTHQDLKKLGVKCCIFIPLSFHGKVIGTISINSSKEEDFGVEIKQGLELFGSMASLAIRKSQAYKEVQEALSTRDLFIAMVAHELRTPVTTIYGYAQLLENKTASFGDLEARWIKEMSIESSRLSMLIKDLLAINRIKANKLHLDFKICSLKEILEKIVSYFNVNFPMRKLSFQDKLDSNKDLMVGDVNKLIQVFISLLDNAIKFSPDNSIITLILTYKKPHLIVTIEDQGKGIEKKELAKIFNAFYQGQTLSPSGMGLGLFLSKHLIERHRGIIRVRSKLNKGTTMEVKLPRAIV